MRQIMTVCNLISDVWVTFGSMLQSGTCDPVIVIGDTLVLYGILL